jgi:hypothetical protein
MKALLRGIHTLLFIISGLDQIHCEFWRRGLKTRTVYCVVLECEVTPRSTGSTCVRTLTKPVDIPTGNGQKQILSKMSDREG